MNRLRALGFAVVAVLAVAPAARSQSVADRGRPVILMLHGRGMLDRDTALLRNLWLEGLRKGASGATAKATVSDTDVRLVWYADVLDPASTESCEYASTDPRARREAGVDPELKTFASAVGNVLGALTNLVSDKQASSQLRALAGDAAFLSDPRKRCASEARLAAAIDRAQREGRPVIVVAHSLGSLVAYDYLSSRQDTGIVRRLVTVGSPVGSADLRRLLIGGDSTDALAVPRSVASWVNVRTQGDALAAPLPIVTDIVTTSASGETDPHEMIGYLRNPATAAAVLSGWCEAFVSSAPAACGEIRKYN
jgi:pimeloyl-ACP methyl ester carboxylesterase